MKGIYALLLTVIPMIVVSGCISARKPIIYKQSVDRGIGYYEKRLGVYKWYVGYYYDFLSMSHNKSPTWL